MQSKFSLTILKENEGIVVDVVGDIKLGEEFLKELVCIGCGDDKDEILAAYVEKFPAAKFWIEDKMENVIAGEKLGLTGILIEHRHNSEKHGHNSMFSWAEIVDYIMENDNTT